MMPTWRLLTAFLREWTSFPEATRPSIASWRRKRKLRSRILSTRKSLLLIKVNRLGVRYAQPQPHSSSEHRAPLPDGLGDNPRLARCLPGSEEGRIRCHYGAFGIGQVHAHEPDRLPG